MRIIKGIGGFYYVRDGENTFECKARGKFRNENIKPTIGDFVKLADGNTVIAEILPRKNELARPAVSNVDQVLIVISASNPKPDLFLIDKLILQSQLAGAEPIICVNKEDLEETKKICKI
ncbi:GTPase RsgA [Treponema sp. R6D11]